VGKKKSGGDPDFLPIIVLFTFTDFLHQMECVGFVKILHRVALGCGAWSNRAA
jgi:hypothetical protein